MRFPTVRIAALTLLTLCAAAQASADSWYQHYDQAERAIANERWQEAVEQLNEALRRRGDSGAEVRTYGMKFIGYFPYLKLGIAYYHLGQADAALRAFETEERLQAIQDSPGDLAVLEKYRRLATEKQRSNNVDRSERIAEIVRSSLEEAARLEAEGRYGDAMNAVARAISVQPEHDEAAQMMDRLREQAARAEQRALAEQRADELLESARARFRAGDLTRAASLVQESLNLDDSSTARGLLREIQTALEKVPTDQANPNHTLAELDRIESLRSEGHVEAAIDSLQPILAAEPTNERATALLEQLLAAQTAHRNAVAVSDLLREGTQALEAGRHETCLSAANRALAIDPKNNEALELVRRAYDGLSRTLLGASPSENIPPAIRFADLRSEVDGALVQLLDEPMLRLSGIVIDESAVEVTASLGSTALETSASSQPVGRYSVTTFTVHSRLEPGRHEIRLNAEDENGLTSSSSYAVMYRRPAGRSPWLIGAALAVPLVALVIVLGVAQARRRRRLTRRFNPYIAGPPVLDRGLFFGRDDLVERILQTVHNNSILLHGERRIGKTSLQHHLKRRLEEMDDPTFSFFPVYIDLQGTPEQRFFATLATDIFDELKPVLGDLQPSLDPTTDPGYDDHVFVRDLRLVVKKLTSATKKRVKLVLLIDEVDELNDYDPRINQRLRSLFMKSFAENLAAVVSGVEIRRQWEREASPWFNFFEEIEVEAIDRTHAEELITHPIRGVFRIERDAVNRIIDLTGCRPYLIQKVCINLVARMYEQGGRKITVRDVDAVGTATGP